MGRHDTRGGPSRAPRAAAWALCALAIACGSSPSSTRGGIDPNAPDEILFQQALGAYGAARAARIAGDVAGAQSGFAQAQGRFDQLLATYPASPRRDNSAYLAGRCGYELAGLAVDPAARNALLLDAVARLEAMMAAYPASPFLDNAAYFAGRSRFRLAEAHQSAARVAHQVPDDAASAAEYALAVAGFDAAAAHFARTLSIAPFGTYGDNAQYYSGRTRYELGSVEKAMSVVDPAGAVTHLAAASSHFAAAGAALAVLDQAVTLPYSASSYLDNARYYLGRSFFDRPGPDHAAAIGAFTRVLLTAGSIYADDALYHRGRSHYALAWAAAVPPAAAELDLALADFLSVAAISPASQYQDNALRCQVQVHVDQGSCAAACAPYGQLLASYPTSAQTVEAQTYLNQKGCPAC
ncbi:MAG TPA: hypothetical protein VFI16_10945 [Anaeromyxobacteraceae bacterium]|nr:hypothetical protein [Anaeromyxobacteraceae bacterium]